MSASSCSSSLRPLSLSALFGVSLSPPVVFVDDIFRFCSLMVCPPNLTAVSSHVTKEERNPCATCQVLAAYEARAGHGRRTASDLPGRFDRILARAREAGFELALQLHVIRHE